MTNDTRPADRRRWAYDPAGPLGLDPWLLEILACPACRAPVRGGRAGVDARLHGLRPRLSRPRRHPGDARRRGAPPRRLSRQDIGPTQRRRLLGRGPARQPGAPRRVGIAHRDPGAARRGTGRRARAPSCGWVRTLRRRRGSSEPGATAHAGRRDHRQIQSHELGAAVANAYGPRLPFLLKVLAAARPLSLQAHPSRDQAAAGFADEERRGIGLDDPRRNYADASHKPEMLCALTRVPRAVRLPAGRRDRRAAASASTCRRSPTTSRRCGRKPDADGVRAVLDRLLHLPSARACAACRGRRRAVRRPRRRRRAGRRSSPQTVVELAAPLPGRRRRGLRTAHEPGHAPAGRGDLPRRRQPARLPARDRRRDHGELGQRPARRADRRATSTSTSCSPILDTTPGPVPLVAPVARDDVETVYPVPVPDFALSRLTLRAERSYELAAGPPADPARGRRRGRGRRRPGSARSARPRSGRRSSRPATPLRSLTGAGNGVPGHDDATPGEAPRSGRGRIGACPPPAAPARSSRPCSRTPASR